MRITLLGCGTSGGVPRIGGRDGQGDWGECDPADPRNRRTRASALLEAGGQHILIDTSPDLRTQLLANAIDRVDAVVWTHEHADHCHGIDDLRPLRLLQGKPIKAFGTPAVLSEMRRRFTYIFEGSGGYPAICEARPVPKVAMIGNVALSVAEQPHGGTTSTGLRFDFEGKSIGYAIDFSAITQQMLTLYAGCDVMVVDCLRRRPHPTHAHVDLAVDLIRKARAGRAMLSHMDGSLDYARLAAQLPDGVEPGIDGLTLEVA